MNGWTKRISADLVSDGIKLTPEGGFAVKVTNKTGGASIKGYIVHASNTTDNAVRYTSNNNADPLGIVYESGIADGSEMWIVIGGIADVFYGTTVTRATFSRVPVAADGIAVDGQAVNEPLPTSPFATDKHFQEIGHPIESRGTSGLAKTILHFN